MANRAIYIRSLIPVMERMQQVKPEEAAWGVLVRRGEGYETTFLGLAHGEYGPQMEVTMADSVARLREFRDSADDWEALALKQVKWLKRNDRPWFAAWGGPSKRL